MRYIHNGIFGKYSDWLAQTPGRLDLNQWDSAPYNRWGFNNLDKILPTALVAHKPKSVSPLGKSAVSLGGVSFHTNRGKKTTIDEMLNHQYIDNLLVWHRGQLVFEEYRGFSGPNIPHLSQSVGKSLTAMVALALKSGGVINCHEQVQAIFPQCKNSGYDGVTLQHLMDMRSGIDWNETYNQYPVQGDSLTLDIASGWKPYNPQMPTERDNLSYCLTPRKRAQTPGADMVYRSLDTEMLGRCLEKITGKTLPALTSEYIWQKMGAEQDSYYAVDSLGVAPASGGHCAIARDYVRMGLIMMNGGYFKQNQIINEEYVVDTYNARPYNFVKNHPELYPCGAYKNCYWHYEAGQSIIAVGVFGQCIFIDRVNQCIVVKMATYPRAIKTGLWLNEIALAVAIRNYLIGAK